MIYSTENCYARFSCRVFRGNFYVNINYIEVSNKNIRGKGYGKDLINKLSLFILEKSQGLPIIIKAKPITKGGFALMTLLVTLTKGIAKFDILLILEDEI